MLHVVLYEPEIAPNTGNVIRLCANTGARLHLIHPLGFALNDKRLRRAGLDYHEYAELREHATLMTFVREVAPARIWPVSTRGRTRYDQAMIEAGDALLFGPETRGLPAAVLASFPESRRLRLPMVSGSRSLNLSNAVAVLVYDSWCRWGFPGGG